MLSKVLYLSFCVCVTMETMHEDEEVQHRRMAQQFVCFDTDVCSHDTSAVLALRLIAA